MVTAVNSDDECGEKLPAKHRIQSTECTELTSSSTTINILKYINMHSKPNIIKIHHGRWQKKILTIV